MKSGGWVYMMSNHKMGTIYIGSTSDIYLRTEQHRQKFFQNSFTAKYGLNKLVWYEWFDCLENMIKRERQLKEWQRNWKIKLIIQKNPEWLDLYQEWKNTLVPAEHWIPACAGMTTEEIVEYNKKCSEKS